MKNSNKIIEFSNNKKNEEKIRNAKLEVAIKMLEIFTGEGMDFHIIVSPKSKLFTSDVGKDLKEYMLLTINEYTGNKLEINSLNTGLYTITGNESL